MAERDERRGSRQRTTAPPVVVLPLPVVEATQVADMSMERQ